MVPEIITGRLATEFVEDLVQRKYRGARVQRVEHRFDQQQVDTAAHQAVRGLAISSYQLFEIDVAKRGIAHFGRQAGGAAGRSEHPGHPARLVRGFQRPAIGLGARQLRRGLVQLCDQRLHGVIGLGDGGGVEAVGFDDIGACVEKGVVNGADQLRLGQAEQVIVTAQLLRPVVKSRAAVVLLGQIMGLDHGAHRAVQQQDAVLQCLFYLCRGRNFHVDISIS